jgi:hypothetical protein
MDSTVLIYFLTYRQVMPNWHIRRASQAIIASNPRNSCSENLTLVASWALDRGKAARCGE